jgi:hypothetical protein
MAIFFNFQTKCSKCEDIHPTKVEITKTELQDMFMEWVTNIEGDLEVYRFGQSFMVTTNQVVIKNYETKVNREISIAERLDI